MFPLPLLAMFGIVAFGPWLGLAYSLAGIVAAALATYYAGRFLPEHVVRRLAGNKLEPFRNAMRRHGIGAVFAVNMVPIPPFGLQGIMAGAIRLKVRDYVLGCVLAMTPGIALAAVFGLEVGAWLEDPSSSVSLWLLGGTVALFFGVSWLLRRWTRQESERQ